LNIIYYILILIHRLSLHLVLLGT